jgi:branched-chain amino acid transport system ATP-binding protein
MSILEARQMVSGYGEVQILWGSSLTLQEGKLTCLAGGMVLAKPLLLRTVLGQINYGVGKFCSREEMSATNRLMRSRHGPCIGTRRSSTVHGYDRVRKFGNGCFNKRAQGKAQENLNAFMKCSTLQRAEFTKAGTLRR